VEGLAGREGGWLVEEEEVVAVEMCGLEIAVEVEGLEESADSAEKGSVNGLKFG
jgi:hypothetical protein